MIYKLIHSFFSLPDCLNKDEKRYFSDFAIGLLLNVSGSWFILIAVYSSVLFISGRKAPVAIYFLCSYFPKIIAPYIWYLFVKKFSAHRIIIISQIVGFFVSLLQIYAILLGNLFPLYISTLFQSLIGSFVIIAYDVIIVSNIKNNKDINKANSILMIIRYAGLTALPLIGAYCASKFGNASVFVVNSLLYLPSLLFFYKVPSSFYTSNPDDIVKYEVKKLIFNNLFRSVRGYSVSTKNKLIAIYLTNTAYGIFNYLLPILAFIKLQADKRTFGIITALCGLFYIATGRLINTNYFSGISSHFTNQLAIWSTLLNGAALLMMALSSNMIVFTIYLLLACGFSMTSMVYQKTSLFSSVDEKKRDDLPNIYNGSQWFGYSAGYLICAILGDKLNDIFFIVVMTIMFVVATALFVEFNFMSRLTNEIERSDI